MLLAKWEANRDKTKSSELKTKLGIRQSYRAGNWEKSVFTIFSLSFDLKDVRTY